MSKREINSCLKRYVACAIYRHRRTNGPSLRGESPEGTTTGSSTCCFPLILPCIAGALRVRLQPIRSGRAASAFGDGLRRFETQAAGGGIRGCRCLRAGRELPAGGADAVAVGAGQGEKATQGFFGDPMRSPRSVRFDQFDPGVWVQPGPGES